MSGRFNTIAAIVESGELDTGSIIHRQLVENCHKEGLKPLEMARAIQDLMKHTGKSAAETASMLGLAAATVCKLLALLELPDLIQSQVCDGAIPVTAAYELSRVEDASHQQKLAEQLVNGELSRDAISGIVRRQPSTQDNGKPKSPGRVRIELPAGRSITLAGAGLVDLETVVRWLEELLAKARKLRPKGLAPLSFAAAQE